ncbi:hypothetical protein L7F22_003646 [Adiantum nelumboides]|nr:hypothetical protein [Adiantum nelumboides]
MGCPDEYGANTRCFVSKQQLLTWLAECTTLMDRGFVEPGYVASRKMNTIGALELCLVQRGTFAKLLDRFMSLGTAMTQYKTPRCIVSSYALSILRESTCWIGVNVEPRSSPPSSVSFCTAQPGLLRVHPFAQIQYTAGGTLGGGSVVYEEGDAVGLTEVKVGQEYEIVMTMRWGLYRYRLGDVVRVTDFCNTCPQVSYVCKKNVLLSINIDKNTEKDLKAVVSTAAKRLAEVSEETMQLMDYTSYTDRRTVLGHYVIFWEVDVYSNKRKTRGCPDEYGANTHSFVSKQQLLTWLAECTTLMDRGFVEPGYVTSHKMTPLGHWSSTLSSMAPLQSSWTALCHEALP